MWMGDRIKRKKVYVLGRAIGKISKFQYPKILPLNFNPPRPLGQNYHIMIPLIFAALNMTIISIQIYKIRFF